MKVVEVVYCVLVYWYFSLYVKLALLGLAAVY